MEQVLRELLIAVTKRNKFSPSFSVYVFSFPRRNLNFFLEP